MYIQVYLSLALLVAMPAWSQVPVSDPGTVPGTGGQMVTPPPVSGQAYPTAVGSETRSNYLRAGLTFVTSYSNDVVGEVDINTGKPSGDVGYSIFPTIAIDKATSRLHGMLSYSPGFTIYQRTSSANQSNQSVTLNFQYRLSPHVTLSLRDSLQRISNVFNQADPPAGEAISGSPQPPLNAVIDLVADQLGNIANTELTYQFSRNGMIGAEGTFTNLDYLKPTQVPGLYDSSSSGGSVFYSHRLSGKHYIGATYKYSRTLAYPPKAQSEIQTHTVFFFYTIYLKPTFSLSFSGGPQHFDVVQFPVPAYGSWSPTLTASMGWQGLHTNLAATYSRVVTGGGGLVGAFQSNRVGAAARWRLARTWSVASEASYANNKNVTPSSFLSSGGGHSISGTVSAHHQLSEHFIVEFGYTDLHQSYSGIPVISENPNINREYVSLSYTFARPLGE